MLPSTVFDCLVAAGNNALVDIRSAEEKADAGVPDLPQPTKLVRCLAGGLAWGLAAGSTHAAARCLLSPRRSPSARSCELLTQRAL